MNVYVQNVHREEVQGLKHGTHIVGFQESDGKQMKETKKGCPLSKAGGKPKENGIPKAKRIQ